MAYAQMRTPFCDSESRRGALESSRTRAKEIKNNRAFWARLSFYLAQEEGFEPPCLLGKRFSRPPRYDRFDNPPRLFQSVELKIRPWKKERTTGENKQKYSVVKVQKSLINQGFSGISVPITSTNFKTGSFRSRGFTVHPSASQILLLKRAKKC